MMHLILVMMLAILGFLFFFFVFMPTLGCEFFFCNSIQDLHLKVTKYFFGVLKSFSSGFPMLVCRTSLILVFFIGFGELSNWCRCHKLICASFGWREEKRKRKEKERKERKEKKVIFSAVVW